MTTSSSTWDTFCFLISGGDIKALEAHPNIADEERRIAQSYACILLGLTILNFFLTGLSAFDVFIDLQPRLGKPLYVGLVVLPVALFWSAVVFCVLRFLIQIGHDVTASLWVRVRRLLTMLPVWCLIPLLGVLASVPIQVRALSDDIRLSSMLVHWERLNANLLEIQLKKSRLEVPSHHECVEALMTSEVVVDPAESLIKIGKCHDLIHEESEDQAKLAHSRLLLDTIRNEIYDDGLVARVNLAYTVAPGASWLIALVMMCLFSFPVLTKALARKRAFEYMESDRGRRDLMITAGIELHAHEAFDEAARPIPLHRYRSVEEAQKQYQIDFEAKAQAIRDRLEQQRDDLLEKI